MNFKHEGYRVRTESGRNVEIIIITYVCCYVVKLAIRNQKPVTFCKVTFPNPAVFSAVRLPPLCACPFKTK